MQEILSGCQIVRWFILSCCLDGMTKYHFGHNPTRKGLNQAFFYFLGGEEGISFVCVPSYLPSFLPSRGFFWRVASCCVLRDSSHLGDSFVWLFLYFTRCRICIEDWVLRAEGCTEYNDYELSYWVKKAFFTWKGVLMYCIVLYCIPYWRLLRTYIEIWLDWIGFDPNDQCFFYVFDDMIKNLCFDDLKIWNFVSDWYVTWRNSLHYKIL